MNTFDGMKQCEASTGVSKRVLRLAKGSGAPGFRGGRIFFDELKPWLDSHPEIMALIAPNSDIDLDLTELKKRKLKKDCEVRDRDIVLRDLDISKKKGETLDPRDVIEFLTAMGNAQNSFWNGTLNEWPVKLSGKTAGEIEAVLIPMRAEICNLYKEALTKWSKKHKLNC